MAVGVRKSASREPVHVAGRTRCAPDQGIRRTESNGSGAPLTGRNTE
jgi:hypothetical protein